MSDRVCIMRDGAIVQIGSPVDLYDRPANRYVADFVGKSNFFDATVTGREGGVVALDMAGARLLSHRRGAQVEPRPGDRVSVAVRPEQILLSRSPEPGEPAGIAVPCQVLNRIFLGEHTEYVLASATLGEFHALAPRQSETREKPFEVGETVVAAFGADAALVLDGK